MRVVVRTALSLINQSLDEVLAEQEGEFAGATSASLPLSNLVAKNAGAYRVVITNT